MTRDYPPCSVLCTSWISLKISQGRPGRQLAMYPLRALAALTRKRTPSRSAFDVVSQEDLRVLDIRNDLGVFFKQRSPPGPMHHVLVHWEPIDGSRKISACNGSMSLVLLRKARGF